MLLLCRPVSWMRSPVLYIRRYIPISTVSSPAPKLIQSYHAISVQRPIYPKEYVPRRWCQAQSEIKNKWHDPDFTAFYRFPHIVFLHVISRLKIYQTGISMILCQCMGVAYYLGAADVKVFVYTTSGAVIASMMLFVISHYLRRFVGILSVNKDGSILKVSHLTFWGHRREVHYPAHDVIPFSDLTEQISRPYMPLKFYSSPEYFYYSVRFGKILDRKLFEQIMGTMAYS